MEYRRKKILLVSLLLVMTGSFTMPADAHWADSWETIEAAVSTLNGIQADFNQNKELNFLAAPLVSTGRLSFRKPDALRWQYLQPIPSVLLMQGQDVQRFQWVEGRWEPDQSARLAGMQVVMQEIGRWLQGDFRSNPDFEATLGPGPEIVLVPTNETLKTMLSEIRLTLARAPGIIDAVTIQEGEAGRTVIRFTNPKVNPEFTADLFRHPGSPE